MVIILFGPPGSGKGTQAQELTKKLNDSLHVSTGALLRQEISSGSQVGKSIQAIIQEGDFVTDDIMLQLIENLLRKNMQKHIIFDGFPRTLNQAIVFDRLLSVQNLKVDLVFDFDIPVNDLIMRICGRFSCIKCGVVYHSQNKKPCVDDICDQCGGNLFNKRTDDTPDILKKRIRLYEQDTLPVKNYYKDKGIIIETDASLPPKEVTCFINNALLKILA